jgi:hypothetical protein
MRGNALALAALVGAFLAGCGQDDDGRRPGAQADVLRVACGEFGTRVLTPVVQAQPDGLYLSVTNETDREAHMTVERSPGGSSGAAAPPGASVHVLAVGPGELLVTCYAGAEEPSGKSVELVDTGIWVSTDLTDCEIAEATHGDPPRRVATDRSDLADLARATLRSFVGLEPGSVIEPADYPERVEAVYRARHDGRTIATMSFYPDGSGGWVEGEARSCPDL